MSKNKSKIAPINLPDSFKAFKQTRDVTLELGDHTMKLTFNLATSFDTTWSMKGATEDTMFIGTMDAQYAPKILAATLHKIDDQLLMHYVPAKLDAVRKALNPNERQYLTEERKGLTSQWVYDAIISRIPQEICVKIYTEELKDWFESAGGFVPTDKTVEQEAKQANESESKE